VWDVEKGVPDNIQDKPWQTCTCLGNWHYDKSLYDRNGYKSATSVVHMLIDIISKNGNLLLSVPMRGDGTIDDKEEAILSDIAAWMDINSEAVYETRPWTIFGEGPVAESSNPLQAQGFNEGRHKPYTAEDIRFVVKDSVLYAHVLAWPENNVINIKSLAEGSSLFQQPIENISLLGLENKILYERTNKGLSIFLPENEKPNEISFVLKIS